MVFFKQRCVNCYLVFVLRCEILNRINCFFFRYWREDGNIICTITYIMFSNCLWGTPPPPRNVTHPHTFSLYERCYVVKFKIKLIEWAYQFITFLYEQPGRVYVTYFLDQRLQTPSQAWSGTMFQWCPVQRHTFRDRRPCTTACPLPSAQVAGRCDVNT